MRRRRKSPKKCNRCGTMDLSKFTRTVGHICKACKVIQNEEYRQMQDGEIQHVTWPVPAFAKKIAPFAGRHYLPPGQLEILGLVT